MKRLLLLLSLAALAACSDNKPQEATQDYTSFTLKWVGGNSEIFSNYKTAYFDEAGICTLLFEHDQLMENTETKEYVMPIYADKIYLFYNYGYRCMRLEAPFTIVVNKKNRIIVPDKNNVRGIEVNNENPKEYPQEKSPE